MAEPRNDSADAEGARDAALFHASLEDAVYGLRELVTVVQEIDGTTAKVPERGPRRGRVNRAMDSLEFAADMSELRVTEVLAELGHPAAAFRALRLCDRWKLPPPRWATGRLAEATDRLWRGEPLPTPEAAQEYRAVVQRLRAAADIARHKADPRKSLPKRSLTAHRKRWARRLHRERPDLFGELSHRSLERWQTEILEPVLRRLADPDAAARWDNYVRRVAKHLGFENLVKPDCG